MKPREILALDRHTLWGMNKVLDAIYPSIKLNCGVCNCKPSDNQNVLHINEYGVCIDCMNEDANYDRQVMDAQDQLAEMGDNE